MPVFDLKKNLVFYGAYHRDPTNVAIHIACVPVLLATGFLFGTNTPPPSHPPPHPPHAPAPPPQPRHPRRSNLLNPLPPPLAQHRRSKHHAANPRCRIARE
ncbi:hypothetical protein P153DRAFT_370040 [Dothidotthia symphoricarpi CBS 119687]|uniref:DUF962-domain-containing protein n=1 Tax=Dothidotthia symphoricarpi CBS 119687 TaxID=1392245 RepID=A0A6A6A384_9PLEO|nr:uncharacterized protein P153DRAFT_370040 [Dothidotthia symphoricarpi CBS 119687]KAF2125367.1 hypothetical protein P153DRAFT_370040 [Dothidotthia symphoricarpi CBS 119687]